MTGQPEKPTARIREDAGLWTVTVRHGDQLYSRNAWTRARAEQIAADLEALAVSMTSRTED